MTSRKRKKNTGKDYERLTQRVFQAILKQQGMTTVKVEHDFGVRGRSTTHQIDVYWRFKHGPVEHTVLVQCKDHASAVDQGEMLKFKGVLDDIPGQPRGLFVTRTGFQSGAIDVGRANGIAMKLLREPTDSDWKGRLRNINVEMRIFAPEFRNFRPLADQTWCEEERARRDFPPPGVELEFHFEHDGTSLIFEDDAGQVVINANDVANGLVKAGQFAEHDWELRVHAFPDPLFMQTEIEQFPRLRLLGAEVEVKVSQLTERVEIRGDEVVAFILHDVVEGTRTTFNEDLRPVGEHGPSDT